MEFNLDVCEVNLEQVICEVLSITNVEAINNRLKLFYKIDAKLDTDIFADTNKLRYVLLNLVQYAISSSRHNSEISLDISIVDTTNSHCRLCFAVHLTDCKKDEAPGGKLLNGQLNSISIEDELINSNSFVKLMGGEQITLREDANNSSLTLKFTLNFLKGKKIHDIRPNELTDTHADGLDEITPCRILLVEDNVSNAKLTVEMLSQFYKHKVTWVENGLQAVNEIEDGSKYDVVLMDIQMPVMDGFEATKQIRQKGVTIPVIALTAAIMPWSYEECVGSGMDAFISKPAGIKKLGLLIKNTIERRKDAREILSNLNETKLNN